MYHTNKQNLPVNLWREEAEKVFLGAAETGSTSALVAEQRQFSWEER